MEKRVVKMEYISSKGPLKSMVKYYYEDGSVNIEKEVA